MSEMVQSITPKDNDDKFSVRDIFPRHIQNSRGDLKPFDPDKLVESLNKETGLDWNECIKIVKESLKKITILGLKTIQTSMIREIMCLELMARDYIKERNIYAKLILSSVLKFKLDESFIDNYKGKQPEWGPLGYITYKRTYARLIEDEDRTEEFYETIRRVVEGAYSIQKEHCFKLSLPWIPDKAQKSAQTMFDKIWNFKFIPPGRGLWMMGTEFIDKHGSMALNNCGFCSTEDIDIKKTKAFEWCMDALMLGVGIGFDTKGAGKQQIIEPKNEAFVFEIPDSREGWVHALRYLLLAYFDGDPMPVYDFSKIRPAGTLIRGFGGVASGPAPLQEMLDSQKQLLDRRIGSSLTSVDIVDMMNLIGKCVVAGNVRRSAQIALGSADDEEYVNCKQDKEALYHHRWASNNSIIGKRGMDYSKIVDGIAKNGEPGIIFLENAQNYSRMGFEPDYKDKKVVGVNPCVTGDTLIAVADGRNAVSIEKLAEEGNDIPVYCKDEKGITQIKMMRNPRITGYGEKIYEIKLDDGSIIKCTGNHEFLLRDLTQRKAIDLKPNDSLIIMAKWETNWDEIMSMKTSNKKTSYWMINDGNKNHFEHSFIFENLNDTKINPGYVIHHKDHNGLNNNVNNLEVMTKEGHQQLHDISGEKNPMRKWYPNASYEEKQRYHENMSKATSGEKNPRYSGITNDEIYVEMVKYIKIINLPLTVPTWKKYAIKNNLIYNFNLFRGKLVNLIKKANIECGFEHFNNPAHMREYKRYIKLLSESDLEIFFDKGIWIIRHCEVCQKEFHVKYQYREQAYCSKKCSNKVAAKFAGKATKEQAKHRHKKIYKKILSLFAKFISDFQFVPTKIQFLKFLNENNINDLRSAGLSSSYQKFLDDFTKKINVEPIIIRKLNNLAYQKAMATTLQDHGIVYNHKVVSVKEIGKFIVYNGTVDEYHNFGIILNEKKTSSGKLKFDMIFTANCGEQSLESFELCCLVETFPSRHESYEEFEETLKYAYLYAKSVTLVNTHWNESNAVMGKNRRIGTSQTGIIDAFAKYGRRTILEWSNKGYNYLRKLDENYSDFFCVPQSIKITTVKPSGTVSLLAGVSPGIHYPHAEYYIRRIRISNKSSLVDLLREANYPIEKDAYSDNSMVVEFPIHEKNFLRAKIDATMWEQLANAIDYQHYWSDNQVSITVTFQEHEISSIPYALSFIEDKLKGLSMLPLTESGYKQMPYETITQEDYEKRVSQIKSIKMWKTTEKSAGTVYCDGDSCQIISETELIKED